MSGNLFIYGFAKIPGKNKWQLSKMTDTGRKGFLRWDIEKISEGSYKAIYAECERLNVEIAKQRNNGA